MEEFESLIPDFGGYTPASLGERTFDGGEGVRVATIEDCKVNTKFPKFIIYREIWRISRD